MEAEIEQLKREIDALKRENDELREEINKLKQTLDEQVRTTKPKPQPPPRRLQTSGSQSQASPEVADSELQRKLDKTIQQLACAQDELTVIKQVTAATQRRQLVQEHAYENLPANSVYEKLRFDPTQEHLYTQLQLTTYKDVLRRQYKNLTRKLDAHVAVHMYERNALTVRDLQSIQSLRDRPVEAAETLLNIIMEQPDAVYLCFLDILKHTEQQHIYQTLVEDRYQDYDEQSSHTGVIRANYVFLLETLDVKFSGLVGQLYSDQVVSRVERDDISAEQTSFRANEKLLSVLSRKSPQQFQLFLDALDKCGQQHVRNVITGLQATGTPEKPPSLPPPRPKPGTQPDEQSTPVTCSLSSAAAVKVHTLPEGPLVRGVTVLCGEVYLARDKEHEVEVYDIVNYLLQRRLTVPNCHLVTDITSCEHYLCIYLADDDVKCIHRLDSQGEAATQWPVNDRPTGLSVNTAHNLLVTCDEVHKIKEFSSHGDLLREITLPDDVIHPHHAIQLTSGNFVVCHGYLSDRVHRVCMITADGRQIVHSHGGQSGSSTGQCYYPRHLAVDSSECVLVADWFNRRVKLLSPTLTYIRDVVSSDLSKWEPWRLCLDKQSHRLYVVENECMSGKWVGRVLVFSV